MTRVHGAGIGLSARLNIDVRGIGDECMALTCCGVRAKKRG